MHRERKGAGRENAQGEKMRRKRKCAQRYKGCKSHANIDENFAKLPVKKV